MQFATVSTESRLNWLARILPAEVGSASMSAEPDDSTRDPRKRRDVHFRLGRRLAHKLLEEKGCEREVGVHQDRSPLWPTGYTGSISHSQKTVWAVVAAHHVVRSIGIDTEPLMDGPTRLEVRDDVVEQQELDCLASAGINEDCRLTLAFSAKEAFYKCCYQLQPGFFGFRDVLITQADEQGLWIQFRNRTIPAAADVEAHLKVRYWIGTDQVFTITWLEA